MKRKKIRGHCKVTHSNGTRIDILCESDSDADALVSNMEMENFEAVTGWSARQIHSNVVLEPISPVEDERIMDRLTEEYGVEEE